MCKNQEMTWRNWLNLNKEPNSYIIGRYRNRPGLENSTFSKSMTPTIDPRRPFKWPEPRVGPRTIGFTPRPEKNDRMMTSLFTARTKFVDSSSTMLNFRWMNFYWPSHFMSWENTFPQFSLKIMFITSIRRYFYSGDGVILGYVMIAGWNSFVPCWTLQILWSVCGQQTCGHDYYFWNRRMKSTDREATQNSSHLKRSLGSIVGYLLLQFFFSSEMQINVLKISNKIMYIWLWRLMKNCMEPP